MVDINWSITQVKDFLENQKELNISKEITNKIQEEEIDGEAFSLLSKENLKNLGIKKLKLQESILKYTEKNIIKLKEHVEEDKIYKQANSADLNDIWDSMKTKNFKLGEELKFVKYLLIRDPPPNIDKKEEFVEYLQKVLGDDSNSIEAIKDNLDDLLTIDLKELELKKEDILKVRIVIEILKQKEGSKNKNEKKNEPHTSLIESNFILRNDYNIYSLVKSYINKTSQNEHSYGLLNPIDEFKKICEDFNIIDENDNDDIKYDEAFKSKLCTFMLWGSKEGLKKFFEENNINKAIEYFYGKNENEEKMAGIYLCIEKIDKIAYLIIWPTKDGYQYKNIEEPNNNILSTLVRYGFIFSSNSILCLTDDEIKNFDYNDYSIFKKNKGLEAHHGKGTKNDKDFNKIFRVENEKTLEIYIDKEDNKKIMMQSNIKQNYLLFYNFDSKKVKLEVNDFKRLFQSSNLFFDESFNCTPEEFYDLIKDMEKYNNIIKAGLKYFINLKVNETLDSIYFKNLLDIDNIKNKFICKFCKNKGMVNFEPSEIFITENNNGNYEYFHKNCWVNQENKKFDFKNIIETNILYKEKSNVYEKCKEEILKSESIFKERIQIFFQQCESRFEKLEINKGKKEGSSIRAFYRAYVLKLISTLDYKIDEKIIKEEYEKIKKQIYEDAIAKRNEIIKKEFERYNSFTENQKINSILEKWKSYMKSEVNNYHKKTKKKKWIIIKSFSGNYIHLEEYQISKILSKYEIGNQVDEKDELSLLCTQYQPLLERENYIITDHFLGTNKKDNFEIFNNIKDNKYDIPNFALKFDGLYDFDSMSNTLIVYNNEEKKLAYYLNKSPPSSKTLENRFSDYDIKKILLIPCKGEYENQSALFFIEDKKNNEIKICAENIKKEILNMKELVLSEKFQYKNFEDFQFIIDIDFLLILLYDQKELKWRGNVYSLDSLSMEDDSLFDEITQIELMDEKNSLFSFFKIKNKNYLFSYNIKEKKHVIKYWEINSQLSKKAFELTTEKSEKIGEKDFTLGNCIVNYFYHSFEKYFLISSIQYKRKQNNQTKLYIYLGNNNQGKASNFKEYINHLIEICENNKKVKFSSVNFGYIDDYKNLFNEKNSSLGEILLRVLETTPIQIAKIINDEFEIMSDWYSLDKKFEKNKESNLKTYLENIKFGLKETIFNFFKLPVIVVCCFGHQSVGKSTFLNELTGSMFNVSGMRCTEGIWMAVKVFYNFDNNEQNNCDKKCSLCKDNNCCLYLTHEAECLCDNCICSKNCELYGNTNCQQKCCNKKNHEKLIECSYPDCDCKCKCYCQCKNRTGKIKSHNHICRECSNNNIIKCKCECNCRHLCKNPTVNHNFICVSLDFEGLDTFERTEEHDILMAIIGSGIGNNIIIRMGPSYDKYLKFFFERLYEGSRKLKNSDISKLFGGAICFSPKDVQNSEQMYREIKEKLDESIRNWNETNGSNMKDDERKNYIFGLFNIFIYIPTPVITDTSFYDTMRNTVNKEIIEDSLTFHRSPIYKTGKEFYENLKFILSVVYFQRYDYLGKLLKKKVEDYITDYKDHAFAICGVLKQIKNKSNNSDEDKKIDYKLYIDNEYIKNLEIDLMQNKKYEVNDLLIIDNIKFLDEKIFQEKYLIEEYNLEILIKNKSIESYSLEIKNLTDYGLVLNFPDHTFYNKVKFENICDELYKIWDKISQKIGIEEKNTSINFPLFISSLIKRRNNNVFNWLKEITNSAELKLKFENSFSPLNGLWNICGQKCKDCYNRCYLLLNHEGVHKCFYEHKCKHKCQLCSNIKTKCKEKRCDNSCDAGMSHPTSIPHSCNHRHHCDGICELKNNSTDCKSECIFDYGHGGPHKCELEKHHCNGECHLAKNNKTRCCNIKCALEFPHPPGKEEHSCDQKHLCNEICYLKNEFSGCKNDGKCKEEFNHKGNHICCDEHFCIADCYLKNLSNPDSCGKKCTLKYPHINQEHTCQHRHKCNEECIYKNKSKECKEKCIGDYKHEGPHLCGITHYCKESCCLINEAKNCGGVCILELPHDEKNHRCGNKHFCKKNCELKEISRKCEGNCSLEYDHQGECKCSLEYNDHICNKKCTISEGCKRDCILIVNHTGKCLCGECKCPGTCKLKDCSRKCNIKCQYNAGHSEIDHLCNAETHYCKEPCIYKNISSNCIGDGFCKYEYSEDPEKNHEHICNQRHHICNGKCVYKEKAKKCKKRCSLEPGHIGDHICSLKIHQCKEKCQLAQFSRNCKKNCICHCLVSHKEEHLCSLKKKEHLCNKECSLKKFSRMGCGNICALPSKHDGDCLCNNSPEEHLCNGICDLFDKARGCKEYCKLKANHTEKEHICALEKEHHLCNEICFLKDETRTLEGKKCLIKCCYNYGHSGNHICSINEIHICNNPCY